MTSAPAPVSQIAYTQYDCDLGKPVNSEDSNNVVSSGRYGGFADGSYTDSLDRATELIVAANVSSLTRRIRFTYNDSSHTITTQSDQTTLNDGLLTSTILYDGLGRTTDTQQYEPGGGVIHNVQQYDAMGRVKRSYNPYRTTSDPTYGYADTAYDALGRVRTVTTSDGAVVTTSYSGNSTTVSDQAGKQRRSITDGLGRLIRVDEPDPDGERWFYKQEDGKITDIQWVNANDDGTYTSPGEGYTEFVPGRGYNHYLWVFNADRSSATLFTEGRDGSPVVFSGATGGGVTDATIGLVADYLIGKAIGTIVGRAVSAFSGFLSRKATEAAAKEAFEIASSGGRHSGFLQNYLSRTKEEIRRGIRSIEKQIAKHEGKISNPEEHIEGWQKLDPRRKMLLSTENGRGIFSDKRSS